MLRPQSRRGLAAAALAALALSSSPSALAQDTKITFQLDWRFEGPAAFFLLPKAKGYFAAEKLDVNVDAGSGSGNAVNRVASGTYQMGFADLAALIEFVGNNPTAPNKPVAVMMVYDSTPAAVFVAQEDRHQGARRPAGQEDGRAGVRRRAPRVPDLREGEQARRGEDRVDRDGPAAARDDARQGRRRRDHRLLRSRASSTSTRAASRTRTST